MQRNWNHYTTLVAFTESVQFQKITIELPYDHAIPLLGVERNEISSSKRQLHSHVHCSVIYNRQTIGLEESKMSINRWMVKENVILILFSLKKEGKSAICDYMDEPEDTVPSGGRPITEGQCWVMSHVHDI